MKKLENAQMENLRGDGWGTVACRVALVGGGSLLGGGIGFVGGLIAANILCHPINAY